MSTEIETSEYYVCISQYSFQDFGSKIIKCDFLSWKPTMGL